MAALLALTSTSVLAGKADDTLNWATDWEISVIDPYYNNARELLIQGRMGWDGLVLYNNDSGEFEPLLAKSWEWKSNTVLSFSPVSWIKEDNNSLTPSTTRSPPTLISSRHQMRCRASTQPNGSEVRQSKGRLLIQTFGEGEEFAKI